jgi:hypothetical protein
VGYKSGVGAVHLTLRELAVHGAAFGGPGSWKDHVPAAAGRGLGRPGAGRQRRHEGLARACATERAHGGQVWTLDGRVPADLFAPRPWQVSDLLLEAEDYSTEARDPGMQPTSGPSERHGRSPCRTSPGIWSNFVGCWTVKRF